ncbi:hypothetical protein [uncultured Deinococcus sp.]|uniref:hypothetical protein n=1 Tax=uncultured Deinococcus sp. TaxID=158789 RepID=UPI0025ED4041|nr:hypothetical protein [uncultured Deinococcus sp.]
MTGLQRARVIDRAHFEAHPTARSYTRPLIEGECLTLPPGAQVAGVAVAFVSAVQTVRRIIWTPSDAQRARREAERLAHLLRGGADRGASA